MKKLLLAVLCLNCGLAQALDLAEFNKQHQQKQQQLFASLDYCSNLGSQEIFNIGTKTLDSVKADLEIIKANFATFKEQKTNCFDNAKDFLDTIIAENFIAMQDLEDDVSLDLQNKADLALADSITLRKQINIALIDSILADIDTSLDVKEGTKLADLFINESEKTSSLISQELNVIYDSMESQLKLDQQNLDLSDEKNIGKIANVAVRSAFLSLSRALLLFENIEQEPKAYNVAKIKTYLDTAHNKLLELKAYSKNLDELDSKKDINQIISQLAIITVDVEVTVKDLTDDNFSENFLNWAGQVYQQTSKVIAQLQKVLDAIYLLETVKEPLPVDITMKEEFLEFSDVAEIKPAQM